MQVFRPGRLVARRSSGFPRGGPVISESEHESMAFPRHLGIDGGASMCQWLVSTFVRVKRQPGAFAGVAIHDAYWTVRRARHVRGNMWHSV